MKFSIDKKTLLMSLSRIQGIVDKAGIKPITSNVLIEASKDHISFSATNLQLGIVATYASQGIITEGRISVNARKLYDIVRELPDTEIVFTEKDNYKIEIHCEDTVHFTIIGLPPEDFPLFTKQEEESKQVEWNTEKLLSLISLTSFSISKDDEIKQNIRGAFIENVEAQKTRMVTTDGYRLSIKDDALGDKIESERGIIIPYKGIMELQKILLEKKDEQTVCISVKKNSLFADIGEIKLFIQLVEKAFPDYKVIIPGEIHKGEEIHLKKDVIKPALKRVSTISYENNSPVVFSCEDNYLTIFTEDSDYGNAKESIELEKSYEAPFSFCINCLYLLDVVNAVNSDIIVEFNHKEENMPVIVRPVNDYENSKYIIMPMVRE